MAGNTGMGHLTQEEQGGEKGRGLYSAPLPARLDRENPNTFGSLLGPGCSLRDYG